MVVDETNIWVNMQANKTPAQLDWQFDQKKFWAPFLKYFSVFKIVIGTKSWLLITLKV